MLFLILFSLILLTNYFPFNNFNEKRSGIKNLKIPIFEMILHIVVWALILEEIDQVILIYVRLVNKMKATFVVLQILPNEAKAKYSFEKWNIIDIIAIGLYLIGFFTRFVVVETVFIISKKVADHFYSHLYVENYFQNMHVY